MDIKDMLNEYNILFDTSINSKVDLFDKLSQRLLDGGYISNKKKFIKDLNSREKQTNTGIEDGFGIPHAKSKAVKEATIAFAHVDELTDYRGLDDKKISIVFMIAVPKNSNDIHLELLSSLARKLMDDKFKEELKKANSKEDIYRLFG